MSFPSDNFGPMGGMNSQAEDFLDDEERERVLRVEGENEERKRQLFEKMQHEEDLKRERKAKGR